VLLPLLFFGGLWLWRHAPLGFALAGLLLMKAAATFLTLVVNSIVAFRWGQSIDPIQTVAFSAGFIGATALLVRFLAGIHATPSLAGEGHHDYASASDLVTVSTHRQH
jgi:hypothetical protein